VLVDVEDLGLVVEADQVGAPRLDDLGAADPVDVAFEGGVVFDEQDQRSCDRVEGPTGGVGLVAPVVEDDRGDLVPLVGGLPAQEAQVLVVIGGAVGLLRADPVGDDEDLRFG
jgi:hypothetical protein